MALCRTAERGIDSDLQSGASPQPHPRHPVLSHFAPPPSHHFYERHTIRSIHQYQYQYQYQQLLYFHKMRTAASRWKIISGELLKTAQPNGIFGFFKENRIERVYIHT
jgi:hypothetical protein